MSTDVSVPHPSNFTIKVSFLILPLASSPILNPSPNLPFTLDPFPDIHYWSPGGKAYSRPHNLLPDSCNRIRIRGFQQSPWTDSNMPRILQQELSPTENPDSTSVKPSFTSGHIPDYIELQNPWNSLPAENQWKHFKHLFTKVCRTTVTKGMQIIRAVPDRGIGTAFPRVQ